ncbi:hypothetical protein FNW02_27360 [Komarekiella sp. 'clone 1']|uniref:DUF5331 domain-containing protein n=1 Tax=Komarekiella delphini-convector SJRDD-AB1 TaxID=2593771 RepID=A0AA40T2A9_9NOST|nr:DUF5331 domain-containing protein [Komarekiella delphini-convector]MBD6619445.1 hypothetical protein [Komarekiella delphini-convector SJRDD-AB1]
MNIQLLRQSLKQKWLTYYEQNCPWLVKMRIWGTYDGVRRPLSGFILATLSVLEPQFDEILTFIAELSNNPDKIVAALGLNFNPDEELSLIKLEHPVAANLVEHAFSEEMGLEESKAMPMTTATKVAPQPIAKTLDSQKLASDMLRTHKLIPLFTVTTEVARTHKPVPSLATATKIAPEPPTKSPAALLREKQARSFAACRQTSQLERLPSATSLTITTEVPSKVKTMPSLALTTEVSSNGMRPIERLPSVVSLPNTNGKHVNIQLQDVKKKLNLSLNTNAHSLASWVDEFCQGTGRD